MDLPNLLNRIKTSPEAPQRFVAIEIARGTVKTAVWQVANQTTNIVSLGSIQDWQEESDDDLLLAIDASLSEALAGLEKEPDEVIFGLPEKWVSADTIVTGKKDTLKTICRQLGLKPVGFVVTTEAVVHYLRDTEGGPPSAILIGVSTDQITVSLVYLGKMEGNQVVGRSDRINSDIEEGLARFPQRDNLPSRMILFDSKEDLEQIKQDIISYEWQDKLPFLHFPQVEILPKEATIKAVAISGGAEVAKSLGIESVPATKPASAKPPPPSHQEKKATGEDLPTTQDSDDFGFADVDLDGKEVREAESAIEELSAPVTKPESEALVAPKPPQKKQSAAAKEAQPELVPVDENEVFPEPEDGPVQSKVSVLTRLQNMLPSLSLPSRAPKVNKPSVKKFHLPSFGLPPFIIIGVILILVLGSAGAYAYWTLPEADITIFVNPETFSRQVTFTLDPEANEPDLEAKSIPATPNQTELEGTQSSPTTGSKTVGERAAGRVEIFNRTLSSKTLASGTTISTDNLQFTLNEEVTIASASSQENEDFSITRVPSSQEVDVTAADIGSQYNVGEGTEFSVANNSREDLIARSVGAFTGGSSREIQAVSEDDLDRIRNDLITDLTQQLEQEVQQQSAGQQGVISAGEPEIIEEEYSAKVGDEADSVSLTAAINQTNYIYQIKDISLLGQQEILSDIPENFAILPEGTTVEVTDSQINEDDTAQVTAKITLKLMPTIETQTVARNLTGKYPHDTEEYLRGLPNYVRSQVTITPNLPKRLATFPRITENIAIEIKPLADSGTTP